MANKFNTSTLVPVAGGGTYAVDIDSGVQHVVIRPAGAITLSSDVNVTVSGTPQLNQYIKFMYAGTITSNTASGFTVNIFGTALTDAQALYEAEIRAIYNGLVWEIHICSDEQAGSVPIDGSTIGTGTIPGSALADDAVSLAKMADITRGSLIVGESSDAPTYLDASTSGNMLVGDGTDLASVAMSGDVTMNSSGVTTIGNGKITNAMLANTPVTYFEQTTTIPTASLLDMYKGGGSGTAPEIIPAQGANTLIDVISVKSLLDYNSATYASGGALVLNYDGSTGTAVATIPATAITGTLDTVGIWEINAGVDTTGINQAIYLENLTAAFTTGNSPLKLSVLYRIIDFS